MSICSIQLVNEELKWIVAQEQNVGLSDILRLSRGGKAGKRDNKNGQKQQGNSQSVMSPKLVDNNNSEGDSDE